ncbi:MAG: transketolase C-terminal domain-containing protein [Rikenellaceae bacterium]
MMEKVVVKEPIPRLTEQEIFEKYGSWAATGKKGGRARNIITSVSLDPVVQENHNHALQQKYADICQNEVLFEEYMCDDVDYVIVAYGSSARISMKVVELLREEGIKVGLHRPITLYPFPCDRLKELAINAKGFLCVEMSEGQMIEDVKLSIECSRPVYHYGRCGGAIHSPGEVLEAFGNFFINH